MRENYTTMIPDESPVFDICLVDCFLSEVDEIRTNAAISYLKYNMDTK